ncbi:hypothetical protein GGR19_002522 [Croceicoccus naphthovorans]|uniref:Uncharacterized protein n=1 Tax=Croceicoccus naphthovorans TaxID=1348774 RepID=A0A0G3XFU9_9SPHN|nr:hypothetical protein AB433_08635 [Croceicoccus naphthovorans]MBB3991087.1 hypothetical protein [Croceicoccus naphthovorans]
MSRKGVLSDVSSEGCSLRGPRLSLRRSDWVILDIDDVGRVEAEVRWLRHGESAGLRFRRALAAAQVDTITRMSQLRSILGPGPRKTVPLEAKNLRPVG